LRKPELSQQSSRQTSAAPFLRHGVPFEKFTVDEEVNVWHLRK